MSTQSDFRQAALEAAWITGHMRTRAATKALHLVDGSADVEVRYAMENARVEPYKQ